MPAAAGRVDSDTTTVGASIPAGMDPATILTSPQPGVLPGKPEATAAWAAAKVAVMEAAKADPEEAMVDTTVEVTAAMMPQTNMA